MSRYDLNYYIVQKGILEFEIYHLEGDILELQEVLLDCKKLIHIHKRLVTYSSPEIMKVRIAEKRLTREIDYISNSLEDKKLDLESANFMIEYLTNRKDETE